MLELLQTINYYVALSGIAGIVVTACIVLDMHTTKYLAPYMRTFGLWLAFAVALFGSAFALIYSDVFDLIPCGLCWFERIALFPQVFIIGVGLYYKDKNVARTGIALSFFGVILGLYHHYIQMGGAEFVKCPTSGADCTMRVIYEFDFVTFPLLAVVSFALLITLYTYYLKTQKELS